MNIFTRLIILYQRELSVYALTAYNILWKTLLETLLYSVQRQFGPKLDSVKAFCDPEHQRTSTIPRGEFLHVFSDLVSNLKETKKFLT